MTEMRLRNLSPQDIERLKPNKFLFTNLGTAYDQYPGYEQLLNAGKVDLKWTQQNPAEPSDVVICIKSTDQFVTLNSENPTYTFNAAPNDAITVQVRPRPFDGTDVWVRATITPSAPDAQGKVTYAWQFDPGVLEITLTPAALHTLNTLLITFQTHDDDKDVDTALDVQFINNANRLLARYQLGTFNGERFPDPSTITKPMQAIGEVTEKDVVGTIHAYPVDTQRY